MGTTNVNADKIDFFTVVMFFRRRQSNCHDRTITLVRKTYKIKKCYVFCINKYNTDLEIFYNQIVYFLWSFIIHTLLKAF